MLVFLNKDKTQYGWVYLVHIFRPSMFTLNFIIIIIIIIIAFSTSIIVRVYRNDKFNYIVDQVDAIATLKDNINIEKFSNQNSGRTTPSIFSLNDLIINFVNDSFEFIQPVFENLFLIKFRARLQSFPISIIPNQISFWFSEFYNSIYILDSNSTLFIASLDNGPNFNSSWNYTVYSIKNILNPPLYSGNIYYSTTQFNDSLCIVLISYGNATSDELCDQYDL